MWPAPSELRSLLNEAIITLFLLLIFIVIGVIALLLIGGL